MSARLPELQLLALDDLVAAAQRVLAHPTANVQRVSMDEVYSWACLTEGFVALAELAARELAGTADPADTARLREVLIRLEFLPETAEETPHG